MPYARCDACGKPDHECLCTVTCDLCGVWTNHTTAQHQAAEFGACGWCGEAMTEADDPEAKYHIRCAYERQQDSYDSQAKEG